MWATIVGDNVRIDASDQYEEALRRLVRKWLRKVSTLGADARRGRVEAVHDMRTGIRRLRTLLALAEGKRSERLRKQVKELGIRLGAVRDLDVALEHVAEKVRKGELFLDEAVFALNAAMLAERRQALKALRRNLRSSFTRRWFRKVKAWTERDSKGPLVHEALPIALEELVREVLALRDVTDPAGRHELRKALKRLRYVLEMFEDALPYSASETAEVGHDAQDFLGAERDRWALAERVEREAEACLVMGEDPRELLAFAEKLRGSSPSDDVVRTAIFESSKLVGPAKLL
jgi:CHAD domain-containing protein